MVSTLVDGLGSQEFGRIAQSLLAHGLHQEGFMVLRNAIGVPDLIATRVADGRRFSIEVKTGESAISLSKRDLQGVASGAGSGVIQALFLSDPRLRWITVAAGDLKARVYRRFELEALHSTDFGFDVTARFFEDLSQNYESALLGNEVLATRLFSAQ